MLITSSWWWYGTLLASHEYAQLVVVQTISHSATPLGTGLGRTKVHVVVWVHVVT